MEPKPNIEIYFIKTQQLLDEGLDYESIRKLLAESGADEVTVATIIGQVKSNSFLKRRKRGLILGLTGSVFLVVGFILTVLFYHSGISIDYVMYGMTSLGAILLLAGLIEVLGW